MSKPAGDPPLCKCHGEPMLWSKDHRRKAGGRWRCSVRNREHGRRYREANREEELERHRRYREANREELRERDRRYYVANRQKRLDIQRRYREANREEVRLKKMLYEMTRVRVRY